MTPIEIMARGMVDTTSVHDKADDFWRAYEGQAKSSLTALSEAGWSLVPSEATDEMIEAYFDKLHKLGLPCGMMATTAHKAMIKAGAYKV